MQRPLSPIATLCLLAAMALRAQESAPSPADTRPPVPAAAAPAPDADMPDDDDGTGAVSADEEPVFETGDDTLARHSLPYTTTTGLSQDGAAWNEFIRVVDQSLHTDSMEELADAEPRMRAALESAESTPGYTGYLTWLREQVDRLAAAGQIARALPGRSASSEQPDPVPHYHLWLRMLRDRPAPTSADKLLPALVEVFTAEGLPAELAWIAEVESTFDPAARSPAGALGLFQLMPRTAKSLGLTVEGADERADPVKNARAAARLLRALHQRFGDWQLALAAYNAGAARVNRALIRENAQTFAEAAPSLPAETRLYVPKVLATITLRTGMAPNSLPAPKD